MDSNKKIARIAGLLYLIVVIAGGFSLMYVPGKLTVAGNGAATVSNIIASETLFRFGIFSGIICYIAFLLLPIVLYKLLKPVNKTHAVLMVALALVSVPMSFINLLNKFAVLTLISKAHYLSGFSAVELQSQILLHLGFYNNGIQLISIFWGLWLFPFGYLVYRSGFLPKVLGILLMLGCFGYIIDFTGDFLFSGYDKLGIASYLHLPSALGEIGTCLWLLIMGAKNTPTLTTSS
jgi:hypothetical protein